VSNPPLKGDDVDVVDIRGMLSALLYHQDKFSHPPGSACGETVPLQRGILKNQLLRNGYGLLRDVQI